MRRIKLIAFFIVVCTVFLVGAVQFVPTPKGATLQGIGFHTFISIQSATTLLFMGSAIVFLMGLRGFTTQLKVAYAFFCTGIAIFSLAQLQILLFVVSILSTHRMRVQGCQLFLMSCHTPYYT